MKKYKKIFIIVPIILGVLLILASLYNSYTENVSLKIVVGTLLIIVPYIYTVLPIVKERYKFNNISRNRFLKQLHSVCFISCLNIHNNKIVFFTFPGSTN